MTTSKAQGEAQRESSGQDAKQGPRQSPGQGRYPPVNVFIFMRHIAVSHNNCQELFLISVIL